MPILEQTNIEPDICNFLEDLQGNILKSHGRDYSVHIFVEFKSPKAAKEWIKHFAESVTSARKQWQESDSYRKTNRKESGEPFVNFLLSAKGYTVLNFDKSKQYIDLAGTFRLGHKNERLLNDLQDPPLINWEPGYQKEIHALILLADDNYEIILEKAIEVLKDVSRVADIVNTEVGFVVRRDNQAINHFGFVDGISQPLFLKKDIDTAKEQGINNWDPSATLDLVLVKDPFGQGDNSFGSYCVYRKLESDVQGFKKAEQELAGKLGLEGKDAERVGALVMGRFRDGTPVTLAPEKEGLASIINNFNYNEDVEGSKCPFQAHIRKVNPRGDRSDDEQRETLEQQRTHRIVRRSITYTYSKEWQNSRNEEKTLSSQISWCHHQLMYVKEMTIQKLQEESDKKVGLLFLCFQSDISNQFNFIQKRWANNNDFAKKRIGLDAVIGQGKKQPDGQKWLGKDGNEVYCDFSGFVTMKGGEFFFAPSISFLKTITKWP